MSKIKLMAVAAICALCARGVEKQMPVLQFSRLLCLWNSPGKNTGVGSLFLHQGIFSTPGSNPGDRKSVV